KSRKQKVRTKYNTGQGVIEGRSVMIVADSLVRGATSRYSVDMIRQASPAERHFLVSSPPVVTPCYYGLDSRAPDELMAIRDDRDSEKMGQEIGVDSLCYLSADGLVQAVKGANKSPNGYCTACFTEDYPVSVNNKVATQESEIH